MASRNSVTITGNLMADPEDFGNGAGVRLVVVETIGYKNRETGQYVEDHPMFWPVTVWAGPLADNVKATVSKGERVTVVGRYRSNVWGEGDEKRSRVELTADEVAVSLRFAEAVVSRNARRAPAGLPAAEPAPF